MTDISSTMTNRTAVVQWLSSWLGEQGVQDKNPSLIGLTTWISEIGYLLLWVIINFKDLLSSPDLSLLPLIEYMVRKLLLSICHFINVISLHSNYLSTTLFITTEIASCMTLHN